ncbi:hypothetical protein LTR78_004510 [Recurvomyces mirabilis]|uniref:Uncharacterized protein n=1 Tax=Recurvomyces mirabilis TaxID=574656 RepID=A0AAE1C292_9PEZI|nr:hypothetical protein LTR78_004510 [Recurvomyces mirabilis]
MTGSQLGHGRRTGPVVVEAEPGEGDVVGPEPPTFDEDDDDDDDDDDDNGDDDNGDEELGLVELPVVFSEMMVLLKLELEEDNKLPDPDEALDNVLDKLDNRLPERLPTLVEEMLLVDILVVLPSMAVLLAGLESDACVDEAKPDTMVLVTTVEDFEILRVEVVLLPTPRVVPFDVLFEL